MTYENIVSWGEDTDSTITTVSRTEPLLEKISKFVTADNPDWAGTATELLEKTDADIPVNSITKRLNVNAGRLFNEYGIIYKCSRTHDGRRIELHYQLRDSS